MPNPFPKIWNRLKSVFNYDAWGSSSDGELFTGRGRSGRVYWTPGTNMNWDAVTGDLWASPTVQACLNWKFRNFPLARPVIRTLNKDEEYELAADQSLAQLLLTPNPEYDWSVLLAGIILSWDCNGTAYLAIETNPRTQLVTELWWLPHSQIKPKRNKQGKIYYEYRVKNVVKILSDDEVLPLRNGLDPYNTLLGMASLATASRDTYVNQQGTTMIARLFMNMGALGMMFSAKSDSTAQFDPEEALLKYKQKATGDSQGEPYITDVPFDVNKIVMTPQEMALDTVLDRPEANICALLGIPPQVVGLHVGRLAKTYANMKEAREAAWEECGLPFLTVIGNQIYRKLKDSFFVTPKDFELYFDTSEIRPLQPDKDKLHERARQDWLASLIDRWTWKTITKMKPLPQDRDVFYADVMPQKLETAVGDKGKTNDA